MVRILEDKIEEKPAAPTCDICGCCTPAAHMTPQTPQQEPTEEAEDPSTTCPICGASLDHLDVEMIIHKTGTFNKYGFCEGEDNIIMQVFKCHECGTVLCDSEEDAKEHVEN